MKIVKTKVFDHHIIFKLHKQITQALQRKVFTGELNYGSVQVHAQQNYQMKL